MKGRRERRKLGGKNNVKVWKNKGMKKMEGGVKTVWEGRTWGGGRKGSNLGMTGRRRKKMATTVMNHKLELILYDKVTR